MPTKNLGPIKNASTFFEFDRGNAQSKMDEHFGVAFEGAKAALQNITAALKTANLKFATNQHNIAKYTEQISRRDAFVENYKKLQKTCELEGADDDVGGRGQSIKQLRNDAESLAQRKVLSTVRAAISALPTKKQLCQTIPEDQKSIDPIEVATFIKAVFCLCAIENAIANGIADGNGAGTQF